MLFSPHFTTESVLALRNFIYFKTEYLHVPAGPSATSETAPPPDGRGAAVLMGSVVNCAYYAIVIVVSVWLQEESVKVTPDQGV